MSYGALMGISVFVVLLVVLMWVNDLLPHGIIRRDPWSWCNWFAWFPVWAYPPDWGNGEARASFSIADAAWWDHDKSVRPKLVWMRWVQVRLHGSWDYGPEYYRLLKPLEAR